MVLCRELDGGRGRNLARLFSELQSFLKVLETESLSCVAESKKESVAELLQELNRSVGTENSGFIPAEDADYMFMSCVAPTENRWETQLQEDAKEARNVLEIIEDLEDVPPSHLLTDEFQMKVSHTATPSVPAHLHHADDSYEEAEPLSSVTHCSADCVDSDSSHYESYGEEEVCVTHRAASLQRMPTRSLSDCRICGLLWRKQWLGRWTKQLFLIKDQVLMCYKCMKDQYPLLELSLHGSRVMYKFKRSKKIQHELKVTTASNETVVLGLQSREQTEDWRKIIEEASSSIHYRSTPWDSPKAAGKVYKSATNKKPLRATRSLESDRFTGEMVTVSAATHSTGYLKVLVKDQWQTLWCRIEDRVLLVYKDDSAAGKLHLSVDLQGCEVRAQADKAHKCRLTISHQNKDLAVLQTSSSAERDRWLSLLWTGCATDTESTHLYEETLPATGLQNTPSNGNPVSGLLLRRVTTPNAYMDDPFGQVSTPEDRECSPSRQLRVSPPNHELGNREGAGFSENYQSNKNNNNTARYSTLPSARFLNSWSDFEIKMPGGENEPVRNQSTQTDKKDFKEAMDSLPEKKTLPRLEEKIRRLEQAVYRAKERVKSGSELNLLSLSKTFKRASCGQTLALFSPNSETTNSEVAIVSPILRRTASAKSSLRRTPSVLGVEKGRVLQKTKEWEMKSSV
ncbi:actin filament-associated protein 1-like 2 isoform X3 [Pristis pectinata]|uniref:actin filament-associated protein 1-like 2 isoform X3 n=1 Tax=Pristis pectinata TaxID=685728 RepID=UPI00223D4E5D|nr:actin filament-associated protein 1-like 2 isoform X3 [Pristis pectinata]